MTKFNFKKLFRFKISSFISILHNAMSYTLAEIVIAWYRHLSICKDPHSYFASQVFNKFEGNITKSERTTAKALLFKSIYGKI